MKNLTLVSLVSVSVSLFLAACNKEQKINKSADPICLISKTENRNGYFTNYQYDSLGRIIKYGDNELVYLNNVVKFNSKTELYLDNKGDVSESKFFDQYPISEDFITQEGHTLFKYNPEGFLISAIATTTLISSFASNAKQEIIDKYSYTYSDGNRTSCTLTDFRGNKTVWLYKYNLDMANQLAPTSRKINLKGIESRNLLSSTEQIFNGDSQGVTFYSYKFGQDGKLLSETTSKVGFPNGERKFYWNCN